MNLQTIVLIHSSFIPTTLLVPESLRINVSHDVSWIHQHEYPSDPPSFTVSHITANSVTSVLHGSSENGLINRSTQMSDLPTNSNISTTMCIDPAVYCDPSMSPTRVVPCSCSNNELMYGPIQIPEFPSNISTAPCLDAPVSSVPCEPGVVSVSRTISVPMSPSMSNADAISGTWFVLTGLTPPAPLSHLVHHLPR